MTHTPSHNIPNDASETRMPEDSAVREAIRGSYGMRRSVSEEHSLELDKNIIVSAGAGSGKTSLLIERLVVLIRAGVKVNELVAITFTRKAAGELQERFFSRLLEVRREMDARLSNGSEDAGERNMEWAIERDRIGVALRSSEDAFIGTIHSFCARLLRLYPAAAGLPADFAQIEEADELLMRRQFWQDTLAEASGQDNGSLSVLRDMEVADEALFQLFSTCVDTEGVIHERSHSQRPDIRTVFDPIAEALETISGQVPPSNNPDPFQLALERAVLLLRARQEWADSQRVELLELMASSLKKRTEGPFDIKVTKWGAKSSPAGQLAYALRDGKDESVSGKPLLDVFLQDVLPVLASWQHWLHDHALAFVTPVVNSYRLQRIRTGQVTYDDLLREAGGLVRKHAGVRSALQDRFSRILVDEFQDTDPEQASFLFALCASQLHGTDWRKDALIPGRLFVVGDDKQSIYRFRKADFQAFYTVCEAIESQGGLHLKLSANFRSDTRICEWVNQAIGPLFANQTMPYQAEWQDLQPFKDVLHSDPPVRRLAVDKQAKGRSDMPRTVAEGRAIADVILQHGDSSFGDWMILVRNHTRVPVLMRMLTDAGIPVALEGGKGDQVVDTIADVHDLLSCLANPSDHIALVATITGIWFGISDAELLQYRQAGGQWQDWMADTRDLQGIPDNLIEASTRLSGWSELVHTVPPLVAYERILADSGIAGALRQRTDGDVAVGMLEMIGEWLTGMQSNGLSFAGCARELGRFRRGELKSELYSDNVPYRDSVRIMTVHGSKGLQARNVILADVSPNKDREPERHIWREGPRLLGRAPVRTRTGRFGKKLLEPAGWQKAVDQEKLYEAAEEIRLLYVAATRAQERLVVCTHASEGRGTWDLLILALEALETPTITVEPTLDDVPPKFALREASSGVSVAGEGAPYSEWQDPSRVISELAKSKWRVRRPSDHDSEHAMGVDALASHNIDDHRAQTGTAGRRFGSAMHTLFEALTAFRKKSIEASLINELVTNVFEHGFEDDPTAKHRAESHVQAFVSSPLWRSLGRADRVLTEVPFTVRMEEAGEEVLASGIVDLAFREGQHWTVVDYKTDRADEETIRDRHASQVSDYVAAWRSLFAGNTVNGIIWSTALDRAVDVSSSGDQTVE